VKVQTLAAAKIDDAIDQHLNGCDPRDPPPEFPATSQIVVLIMENRRRSVGIIVRSTACA
jgi:hypothetical protein